MRRTSPTRRTIASALVAAACFVFAASLTAQNSGQTTFSGTIDLVPGPDIYAPRLLVINRPEHRLYVAATGGTTIKFIDTISQQVIGDVDPGNYTAMPGTVNVAGLVVDESAAPGGNKLYAVVTAGGSSYLRIIDCADNTNLTREGSDILLPISGTQNEAFSSVTVNSANHKVYVATANGTIVVVDTQARKVLQKLTLNAGNFVFANRVTNKVFVLNSNGGGMINSTDDSFTPLALPFRAYDAVVNPGDGRIYFVGDKYFSFAHGTFVVDASSGQLITSQTDVLQYTPRSVAIVPGENMLYVGTATELAGFDLADLTPKVFPAQRAVRLAHDPANASKLFLLHDQDEAVDDLQNMAGVLQTGPGFDDFVLERIGVGYQPNFVAVNSRTGRVFVPDPQAAEVVILDANSRTVAGHLPFHFEFYVGDKVPAVRRLAVSERLNRVYVLSRLVPDPNTQFPGASLNVFDAGNNQFLSSISFLVVPEHIAVDDTRRRIYVTGYRNTGSSSWQLFLVAFDQDSEAELAMIPLGAATTPGLTPGIVVNQVTGRVYVSNVRSLSVIDGTTLTKVTELPGFGPLAINQLTNKIYLAQNRSVPGDAAEVRVIDGATNTVERTLPVPVQRSNDLLQGIAVDPISNTVYVVANNTSSSPTPPGRVTAFDANHDYQIVDRLDIGREPKGLAFDAVSRQLFAANNLDATVSVLQNHAPARPNLLGNISTRAQVGAGDNVLIGGFIVTGTQTKKVMVRAIGPSLSKAGVANPLSDPTLELHDANGSVLRNDDWQTTNLADFGNDQSGEIAASGIAPSDPRESAIIARLAPGPYTAIMRGKNGATGVGVVEAYDLDQTVDSHLANVSSRGRVGAAGNVMIGGIIVVGTVPSRLVVRALGPSLTNSGVTNALSDPILELRDPNGLLIASNDDWQTRQAEVSGTNLAPNHPRESALVAMLYPANYTAIVRGKNGATGIALVEAYRVE